MDDFSLASIHSLCSSLSQSALSSVSELADILSRIPENGNDRAIQLNELSGSLHSFSATVERLDAAVTSATTISPGGLSELSKCLSSCQTIIAPLGKQVMRLQADNIATLNGMYVQAHGDALVIYAQQMSFFEAVLAMPQPEDQNSAMRNEDCLRLVEQSDDARKMLAKAGDILIEGYSPPPPHSSSSKAGQPEAYSSSSSKPAPKEAMEDLPPPSYESASAGPSSSQPTFNQPSPSSPTEGGGRLRSLKHSFKALTSNLLSKPDPLASAVCEASRRGDMTQISALLKQGANIDGRNDNGETPLSCAILSDQEPTALFLVSAGAGGSTFGFSSTPPIFLAASRGQLSVAEAIYTRGGAAANVKKQSMVGHPYFFDVVASEEDNGTGSNGSLRGARWLLDRGADPNAESASSRPAVVQAAKTGSPEMVDLLLEYGAKLKSEDLSSDSLLAISLDKPGTRLMEVLIRRGAKLSSRTAGDERVLVAAIKKRKYAHARCLLEAGADGNTADEDDVKVIVSFVKSASGMLPDEQVEIVRLLLRNGAKPTSTDSMYRSAFQLAIEKNLDARVVGLLAQHGGGVNKRLGSGETPLTQSIISGRKDYVGALLSAGAITTLPNKTGKTPMNLAALRQDADLIRLLMSYGAAVDDQLKKFVLGLGDKGLLAAMGLDGQGDGHGSGAVASGEASSSQGPPPADDMPPSYDDVTGGSGAKQGSGK